jgi:hypothetical protein
MNIESPQSQQPPQTLVTYSTMVSAYLVSKGHRLLAMSPSPNSNGVSKIALHFPLEATADLADFRATGGTCNAKLFADAGLWIRERIQQAELGVYHVLEPFTARRGGQS